ncbi:MAG: hypothetical protein ACK4SZ_02005 [Allosphingosinicella sp.]|uniref:hypothetical protein n=1 Tax=Allosphingosinicella sp. TaxID=2823234 RepID=UPI0039523643
MVRVIIGAAVAAIAMLIVGFLLFATPLNGLGTGNVGNAEAAQLQSALALNLPRTGTYAVPDPNTAEQTVMYGQGPVATIHYNTGGYAAGDPTMIVYGLVLNFVTALLIGLGLLGIDRRVGDFASRARLVIPFAVGAAAFMHLSEPLYLHHDWGNALYTFFGNALALAIGGLVVAWFIPHRRAEAPADAPTDV